MSGRQHTPTQQNGRIRIKLAIVFFMVTFMVIMLGGCSPEWWLGEGRGDWRIDLYAGYSIVKVNSMEIVLTYRENWNNSAGSFVIENYYIMTYQLCDPYICLEGICTQEMMATKEELSNNVPSYCIVNTTNGEIFGPFESYNDFLNCCHIMKIEIAYEWVDAKK